MDLLFGFFLKHSFPYFRQMTETTKEHLVREGSFNYIEREDDDKPESIASMRTFWLIGRTVGAGGGGNEMQNGNEKDSAV